MRIVLWFGLAAAAGCGRNLEGWWDLDRWEIRRGDVSAAREQAGFLLVFEDSVDYGLSYDYDQTGLLLVPLAEPWMGSAVSELENTPEGEPDLVMNIGDVSRNFPLEFDVVRYRGASVVLESLPMYDGTVFRWELER